MQRHQCSAVAQLVLEGVPLPATKQDLLSYAQTENAPSDVLSALEGIPDKEYSRLDDVGEAVTRLQPSFAPPRIQTPQAESGDVPGGDAYIDASAEPGQVRGRPEVLLYEQQLVREPAPVDEGIPEKGTRGEKPLRAKTGAKQSG